MSNIKIELKKSDVDKLKDICKSFNNASPTQPNVRGATHTRSHW